MLRYDYYKTKFGGRQQQPGYVLVGVSHVFTRPRFPMVRGTLCKMEKLRDLF